MGAVKKFFDVKFWKFVLVGIVNTIVGYGIMLGYYNVAASFGWFNGDINYWIGSAANIILGSILSYFLNKYFTFQNKDSNKKTAIRFIINIAVCYLLAYGIAKPLITWVTVNWLGGFSAAVAAWLSGLSFFAGKTMGELATLVSDNISMLAGSVLFVMFNYVGQRFFAFKEEPKEQEEKQAKENK